MAGNTPGGLPVGALPATGNLPAELTSFVGRQEDVAEVVRLLAVTRLATLTGPAGVGKTRLALCAAGRLRPAFPDGVWLVELEQLRDPALVAHAVAQALGVHNDTGQEPLAQLAQLVGDRRLLLVLDGCEHLAEACGMLAGTVLAGASELRILAASRQALRVPGEQVWLVPPLALVPRGQPHPSPEQRLSGGGRPLSAAVQLFAERAAAALPEFTLTAGNEAQVATICRRLDGIPLAIELAAVRLRTLSVEQILARLDDQLGLLSTGFRGRASPYRTLRAAIDGSLELCTPAQRTLWARVSVFAGDFAPDAVEGICAGAGIAAGDVGELLDQLAAKSVLIREDHAGQPRYRLLETLRQYGRDRLRVAGEQWRLGRAHAQWYLGLAETAEREWFGPGQHAWFQRLRQEHANLRAALDFCVQAKRIQSALRLASALWFHWFYAGLSAEGRHWLGRVLALPGRPSPARAKALWASAFVTGMQGDLQTAGRRADGARELARRLNDPLTEARAIHRLGTIAVFAGDPARAEELSIDALARYQALGVLDQADGALARITLAGVRMVQGDLAGAAQLCRECHTVCQASGDHTVLANALVFLARIEWTAGELRRARRYAREGLLLRRELTDPAHLAHAVEVLAWIAATAGESERAAVLLGAGDQVWRSSGLARLLRAAFLGPHRECVAAARLSLGQAGFEAAFARGRELSTEQIIGYALGEVQSFAPGAEGPPGSGPGGAPGSGPGGAPGSGGAPAVPLTPRESEVAGLIAAGLSNKQIAVRLAIAQRTAETHVEHILAKLGFSSRVQVAAWVAAGRTDPRLFTTVN